MKLMRKSILPVVVILTLAYLGKYIYIVDGQIDIFRFCLVFGIPFGIPYMLFVIPIGGSPTTSIVILVLNVIIGAFGGCLIAALVLVKATAFFLMWLITRGKKGQNL